MDPKKLKVADLRSELERRGVNVAGLLKPALVAKLEESLAADAGSSTTASGVGVGGSAPTPEQVRWRGALAAGLTIRVTVGRKVWPVRAEQLAVLSAWARGDAFDAAWLLVDPATGAPTHFVSQDGKRDKLSIDDSPAAVAAAAAAAAPGSSPSALRAGAAGLVLALPEDLESQLHSVAGPGCVLSGGALVAVTALCEYLCAEILELAGNAARDCKCSSIQAYHVAAACGTDAELAPFFGAFALPGLAGTGEGKLCHLMGASDARAFQAWVKEANSGTVGKKKKKTTAAGAADDATGPVLALAPDTLPLAGSSDGEAKGLTWEVRQLLRLESAAVANGGVGSGGLAVFKQALALAGGAPRFINMQAPSDAALACEQAAVAAAGARESGDTEGTEAQLESSAKAEEDGVEGTGDSGGEDGGNSEGDEDSENSEDSEAAEEEDEDEEDEEAAAAKGLAALMALDLSSGDRGGGGDDDDVKGRGGVFVDELDLEEEDDDDKKQARLLARPFLTSVDANTTCALRFPATALYMDPQDATAASGGAGAGGATGWEAAGVEVVRLARRGGVLALDLPSVRPALADLLQRWLVDTLRRARAFERALLLDGGGGGEGGAPLEDAKASMCVAMALEAFQPLGAAPSFHGAAPQATSGAQSSSVPGGSGGAVMGVPSIDEPAHLRPLTSSQVAAESALALQGEAQSYHTNWVKEVLLEGGKEGGAPEVELGAFEPAAVRAQVLALLGQADAKQDGQGRGGAAGAGAGQGDCGILSSSH